MRLPRPVARLALAAIALLAASACGDSTGPTSINGRYTLRLIDGQPLPWLVVESRITEQTGTGSATMREYIDGATLVLLEPERDTLRIARRTVTTHDAGPVTTASANVEVPYRLEGDRMCPSDIYEFYNVPCGEDRPTVPRRGDSLFIRLSPIPSAPLATYTFVREGR